MKTDSGINYDIMNIVNMFQPLAGTFHDVIFAFSKLSHNSSSWKQMSIRIVFCHIFWNSLKFCKRFRWKRNKRQSVWIRWPMENYNPGHSILHSSQLQSFSYITETLAGHLYGSDWEAEIHMLLNCSVLHSSHGKTNHRSE